MTKWFEVRRLMECGGWATGSHLRFSSREEAERAACRLQDAVRAKGVFVEVAEVCDGRS